MKFIRYVITMVILVIIFMPISKCVFDSRTDSMKQEIAKHDGTVIGIDQRLAHLGPFNYFGKGGAVYRIDYTLNGEIKQAWVRYGSHWNAEWVFDYVEK